MSDFNYDPLYGAQIDRQPRVLSSEFGDGYQQRVGDGINRDRQTWSLTFTNIIATINTIEAFLTLKAGVTSFTWTPSGGSEIRVVCDRWQRIKLTRGIDSINTEFRQVFE